MTPITNDSLKQIGFVPSNTFGRNRRTNELNWRGAPLWWDGAKLKYQNRELDVKSIEEVTEFIKSLKIAKGRGKRPVA
jgi:hypothetical protein